LEIGGIVTCTVVARHPWGVVVAVVDAPDIRASMDYFQCGRPPRSTDDLPPVGTELRAVTIERRGEWWRLCPAD
jgi:hypothetical protein